MKHMGREQRQQSKDCKLPTPLQDLQDIDPIVFSRIRLIILTYLYDIEEATFTELKTRIGLTAGNLSTHLKQLYQGQYLYKRLSRPGGKETIISISASGRDLLRRLRLTLNKIDYVD